MPPRWNPRRNLNNETPIPPPQPPTPQFDTAALNAVVAAVVVTTMAQYQSSGSVGGGTPVQSVQVEAPVRSRECSYKDFTNCKPLSFKGTGGVIALSQWFEKTEAVFEICSCPEESKVKFAACTFETKALTWWNSHVKSLSLIVANYMGWERGAQHSLYRTPRFR